MTTAERPFVSEGVWERAETLSKHPQFRAEIERLMPAYLLIQGTKDCPTLDKTALNVATLVAILEANPDEKQTANSGGVVVTRSYGDGFEIHLWGVTVHPSHFRMSAVTCQCRDSNNEGPIKPPGKDEHDPSGLHYTYCPLYEVQP